MHRTKPLSYLFRIIVLCFFSGFVSYGIASDGGKSTEPLNPEHEVTIDSPPEVIAEDFLRVAAVPPSWFYLLYNWVGTFDIDPNNVTEQDLEKYVTDTDKREKIKQAIEIIKKFHTYPGKYRLIKWETMPIDISLTYEPEMDEVIRNTIELIKKTTNIKFKIHDDRITEYGISVDTYGLKKEHTDVCVHDYACTDLVITGSTTYFKGDGWETIELINTNKFINAHHSRRRIWDMSIYFTPNTLFTDRFKHDYHVSGAIESDYHDNANLAICNIYNNHQNKEISKSLATECIFRGLGLTQFSFNKNSILSQRSLQLEKINWETRPNEYDLLLLRILYDERLKSGMTKDEVKPLVVKIINDIAAKNMRD